MQPVLSLQNVEKTYGGKGNITRAVDGISFDVHPGEYVAIMGPSGSGKTTLLNCIATIDRPSAGNILIEGQNVTAMKGSALERFRREKLGFVFQDFNLLDTLTCYENIALALTIRHLPADSIEKQVRAVAARLSIIDVLPKFPYQISGGQKQRVAAARAIITQPAMVLADEPTGALDSRSARVLLESFEKLNQDLSTVILMVTHDAFAASYCRRILFIKDGRIFNELYRGNDSRKQFFDRIIQVVTLLGGELSDAL